MRHLLRVSFDLLPGIAVNRLVKPVFVTALIGLIVWAALRTAPDPLARTLAQGDQALAAGRLQDALGHYQQASALPDGLRPATIGIAHAQLALALETPDDPSGFAAARDAWHLAAGQGEPSHQIYRGLAVSYLGLGETLAAAQNWELAYAQDPSDPSLWLDLAPALLREGHWDAAARAYTVLTQVEPENTRFHYWAGALRLPTEPAAARDHLRLALADPLYAGPAQALLTTLDELAALSDRAHSAARLGLAYLAAGEPYLAERQLRSAVEARPDLADAWAYLGLAQDLLGDNGRPAIARALELAPDSPLAHSLMGRHWLYRDRPDLARPEFVSAHQLDATNPAHLADVASTYQLEGDLYAAQAWLQAAVQLAPDDPAFWTLLGLFYVDALGDAEEGLLAAQRAVALAPEDPAALDALGWAQFRTGRLALAETNLLAALQRAPADPAVHYHLGKLASHLGQSDRARAAFEQALALSTTCGACPSPEIGWVGRLALRELDGS